MKREVEQIWTGRGKKDCLKAIKQAKDWLYAKRPDMLYDNRFAMRSMHFGIMDRGTVHWFNNGSDGWLCDFVDNLYSQIENMKMKDVFYISVSFRKGDLF